MRESPAIIVGAGPAGLSSAAALQAEGIDAVILDRGDEVGASWRRRYQNLTLHTVRRFSGLAHHAMPRSYPKYVPRDLFVSYLEDYARRFDLKIEHGCRVQRIRRDGSGSRFRIETSDGVWRSSVVVVATGHNGTPIRSALPGQGSFHGTLIHSDEYDTPAAFRDSRVLVVGAGNSGSEIAADLARHGGGHVAISVRTPPPIVPRDVLGSPVQVVGILLSPLPAALADRFAGMVARLAMGDLTGYGLQRPGWQPFTARRPPTIDTGFVAQVKQGRIQVRPAVAEVTPAGVRYADGNEESFDHVIMATGFSTGLRAFLDLDGLLREDGFPLPRCGEETSEPGLYFMGYTETHRGHLFEVKRDSRKLAKRVRTYLH
ncbi:MAG TPA: NAD(P)/FAD-dependent oxidoreductase [Euzebyales bacterium]|nr:NAD(P)/FAD-dependent oxidoreductase [Euzebyales bacterium]